MTATAEKNQLLQDAARRRSGEKLYDLARPQRFTIDGSAKLEDYLAGICRNVLAEIRLVVPGNKLEAILLGGGYGRGEGGVLKTAAGDRPYNDLDFYIFMRGNCTVNERCYGRALSRLAEELSVDAGVEVEIKLVSLAKLRRSCVTMFYYDLVMGHRKVWGDDDVLRGCEHHRQAERIPLSEATRLLMNRCSGLLFAKERLQRKPFTSEDADFVGRNLAKAQLAFGDIVLTAYGQYHWSCRERHARLERIDSTTAPAWLPRVLGHHAAGVSFKLHPCRTDLPVRTLEAQYRQLTDLGLQVWLWLESQRLEGSFTSARDYVFSTANKCPETTLWRNVVINVKTFGARSLLSPAIGFHPRARLLSALSILLFEPSSLSDPLLRHLQAQLRRPEATFNSLAAAYERLWRQFN